MSRTHTRPPHTPYPPRWRNRLHATAAAVITDHNIYGNRIPFFDNPSYDDVIRDATQWSDNDDALS